MAPGGEVGGGAAEGATHVRRHVLGIGTDVQYLFLEVIPRLAPGVAVHVHDIFLPDEYPQAWVVDEHRFWSEQYLLQAFLAFNDSWARTRVISS